MIYSIKGDTKRFGRIWSNISTTIITEWFQAEIVGNSWPPSWKLYLLKSLHEVFFPHFIMEIRKDLIEFYQTVQNLYTLNNFMLPL